MAEHATVLCSSCSTSYRVPTSKLGRKARCTHCGKRFVLTTTPGVDDETILSWMSEPQGAPDDDPTTADDAPPKAPAAPVDKPEPVPADDPLQAEMTGLNVHLVRIDDEGACFEFAASALLEDAVRNSLPRRCVGCGTKDDLNVHLVHWPERMPSRSGQDWEARQNTAVRKLASIRNPTGAKLLSALPKHERATPPFHLPFPVFACGFCHPAQAVVGRVIHQGGQDVCQLRIASLSLAVGFYRNAGGRNTPEYHRLVEQRDLRHDAWMELDAAVRHRLAAWFEPQAGERFVRFFRDSDVDADDHGHTGLVVTDRRVVCKQPKSFHDYAFTGSCRVEIKPRGERAVVRILEKGERPADVKLEVDAAEQLTDTLRTVGCRWPVSR